MAHFCAATQLPMLGTVGFATLVACRVALGAGEGPTYPVALHSAYKWFPNELRTLPTAIIAQGAGIGIMVALLLLNWLIVNYFWHWAFGVLGIAGLGWTAAWMVLGREGSLTAATATDATPAPGLGQRRAAAVAGDGAHQLPGADHRRHGPTPPPRAPAPRRPGRGRACTRR